MNYHDIKLVIDRLHSVDIFIAAEDNLAVAEAISMLEKLGNQVAEQAAVIEKLRDALQVSYDQLRLTNVNLNKRMSGSIQKLQARENWDALGTAKEALATPTDSKQILAEWLNSVLGEPTTFVDRDTLVHQVNGKFASIGTPLFKKPIVANFIHQFKRHVGGDG